MRAPPEVPQSRRGRKGRASGRPWPAAAMPAPMRAPLPPAACRQAIRPHRRRAESGPPQPAARVLPGPRRGERGARNLLSACGGRSGPGAHKQAGFRPQRPRRRQLPPGRRIPAPSTNHNTKRAAGRGEGVGDRDAPARDARHCDAVAGAGPRRGRGGAHLRAPARELLQGILAAPRPRRVWAAAGDCLLGIYFACPKMTGKQEWIVGREKAAVLATW
ncbi:translation initiation factor IF-2-like [Cervus canadensis]|uniref:translation initiation factor IF-2-like n=1 Tax=Cervus canadensis TaxID=1574408 RepID=UPI001CA320E1|nr:translation initiation factor IF-2-like [Cervus canadensis]